MSKLKLILCLIGLVAFSCKQQHQNSSTDLTELNYLLFDTTKIAIFLPDSNLYEDAITRGTIAGMYYFEGKWFAPTADEFQRIEDLLTSCVTEIDSGLEQGYHVQLDYYKRQYFPIAWNDGDKEIWVNCFPAEDAYMPINYWRKNLIFVLGGGANYFSVYVNLSNNSYHNLSINAPM